MNKETEQVLYDVTKSRMDEIGLEYTMEQLDQMADFITGLVALAQQIGKDCMLGKIPTRKED